jgi:hypothetical protein
MIDAAGAINFACNGFSGNTERVLAPLPFLSVPGNHDGLTFGVIKDSDTKTWELGLNRLEFHLASLLLLQDVWPNACVSQNEALCALLEGKLKSLEGAPVFSKRVLERFTHVGRGTGRGVLRHTPVALKGRINTPKEEDDAVQPGYFSLLRNGFRIIVLDTRSKNTHRGSLGPVQLGWLFCELSASLSARQPVLIFTHHHPRDFSSAHFLSPLSHEGTALRRVFIAFPHVLGYFYGHAHKFEAIPEDGVWFVQAPSLVDFPLGALLLRVERQTGSLQYQMTIEHVKVGPDRSNGAGLVLDALQDEALIYAWYDAGAKDKDFPEYGSLSNNSHSFMSFSKEVAWRDPGSGPTAQEALGSSDAVERISDERVRIIKEPRGAWYVRK